MPVAAAEAAGWLVLARLAASWHWAVRPNQVRSRGLAGAVRPVGGRTRAGALRQPRRRKRTRAATLRRPDADIAPPTRRVAAARELPKRRYCAGRAPPGRCSGADRAPIGRCSGADIGPPARRPGAVWAPILRGRLTASPPPGRWAPPAPGDALARVSAQLPWRDRRLPSARSARPAVGAGRAPPKQCAVGERKQATPRTDNAAPLSSAERSHRRRVARRAGARGGNR